ncbi:hypothetical protein [Isoalcanivorax beigongshangi]|uniref:Uncharacterized protein n=1 Tax=Isoalcanivorax beigongshangi TaxID=3238810 RepID=A0ABV4AJN0_9GAMM
MRWMMCLALVMVASLAGASARAAHLTAMAAWSAPESVGSVQQPADRHG